MAKIPIVLPPARTSSLSQGYFEHIEWPAGMSDTARKVWCRVLAQAVAPVRAAMKDTVCPLVAPGSPAEHQSLEAQVDESQHNALLMKRFADLEVSVGKQLEEFKDVVCAWISCGEAVAELEALLSKQKVDRIKQFRESHEGAKLRSPGWGVLPGPSSPPLPDTAAASAAAAAAPAEEGSNAAIAALEAESGHEASIQTRGRWSKPVGQGSRARDVSPLMIPVLWGLGPASSLLTGLLPSHILNAYLHPSGDCIVRRSTPDAHPKYRLLAPDKAELQPWRPRA